MSKKLSREEYLKDPFDFAKNVLLGSYLYTYIDDKLTGGMITEVEVYPGGKDKGSHTYLNKKTKRTEVIFGPGGYAYVYFIYGMYHQFCTVVCEEGIPSAILVRALEPIVGIETMKKRRKTESLENLTTGPGKVTQALGITKQNHYGADLTGDEIWIEPRMQRILKKDIVATPRIGIDYAGVYAKKPWRFVLKNKFVSK